MWVICFQPNGTDKLVPQILCFTEQEAKDWVKKAPFSVVGTYVYMFVPTANPMGVFKREENYQFPAHQYSYPEYCPPQPKQWQYEVGDFPNALPQIMCTGGLYDSI